ncbi:MAG: 7-cyano-7-deazaguanine synthase [Candidatus Coatesbacteria bacterium]|nr:7-cyano-7-deazaguanine synthase [Candidatus Coatesbacteria bacterium]
MAKNEALLMYSGGLDSTASAIVMLEQFEKLHLLTYDYGYGQIFLKWARKGANGLIDVFGRDRFVHVIASVKDIFQRIFVRSAVRDYKRYKSRFIWCLACKLAMHTGNIVYCLEHDLQAASDGSSSETEYYVEQMPQSVVAIRDFYKEFGLQFVTPVYDIGSREAKFKLLAEKGVKSKGIAVRDRNPGTQPLCVPGNLIHFASTFFGKHPDYDEKAVLRFIEEKTKIAKKFVEEKVGRPAGK